MTDNHLSIEIQNFINRPSTKTFLDAAYQFVEVLEIENVGKEEFYKKVHNALINLYSAGHKLEQIELKYSCFNAN